MANCEILEAIWVSQSLAAPVMVAGGSMTMEVAVVEADGREATPPGPAAAAARAAAWEEEEAPPLTAASAVSWAVCCKSWSI